MDLIERRERFVKYVEDKILFYIESHLWSNVDASQFRLWFNNFKTLDQKFFACKLLNHFIYYSEQDLKHLCEFGLFDLIIKRYLIKNDIDSQLQLTNDELVTLKSNKIREIFLMPLEDDDSPTDSSRAIIVRIFSVDLRIPDDQIISISNIENAISKGAKHIIIIDDFIGSGNQIETFWTQRKITFKSQERTLYEISCLHPEIEFEYLCLIATSYGLEKINISIGGKNIKITFCEELTEEYRVFGSKSIYLEQDEIQECKEVLGDLCSQNGFSLFGHDELDYAISFHHAIPDTSLRIFWKKKQQINNLFRNKQTEPPVLI